MRIKKKHVLKESLILEGLLIDDLNTIHPFERKVLKYLHRKYSDKSTWDIPTNDVVDNLHEKWMIGLEQAFKIVHTYVYKRDYLFKENDYVYDVTKSEIFKKYNREFLRRYRDSLDDERIGGEDNRWNLKIGGDTFPFEPSFWDGWDNFTIYLPIDSEIRWSNSRWSRSRPEVDERDWERYTTLINGRLDFETDTLKLEYKIDKESDGGTSFEKTGVIASSVDMGGYPEEITYESGIAWVSNLVNNIVKPLVEDFEFPAIEEVPNEEDPEE